MSYHILQYINAITLPSLRMIPSLPLVLFIHSFIPHPCVLYHILFEYHSIAMHYVIWIHSSVVDDDRYR